MDSDYAIEYMSKRQFYQGRGGCVGRLWVELSCGAISGAQR